MRILSIPDRRKPNAVSLIETLVGVATTRPRPRITVVRAGALGDTILILPTLQLLRDHIPGVQVTLVGSAWAEALRPLLPFAVETARIDAPALTPLFGQPPAADHVGLFSSADAVVLYAASPTSEFVGNVKRCCRGPVIVRTTTPPADTHAAAHFAGAIVREPLTREDLSFPVLQPSADLGVWARHWVAERIGPERRPVAIHPGSGGRHKQWPPACFAGLAAELGGPIVLLEGPADAEACHQVATQMPPTLTVANAAGLSLLQVAGILTTCRLYVGNDSGISHMAAALGTPTVTVLGPTDPRVWAPLGPRVVVVAPGDGMASPTPAAVLEAVRRMAA